MTTFRDLDQRVARNAWANGRRTQRKKAKLVFLEGTFCWLGEREDDGLARNAGFTWSKARKYWWSRDWTTAAKLVSYADPNTKELLDGRYAAARAELDASRATDADIDVPAPAGLALMPFQRAGVAYAMKRPATLIADDMGLGKTVQAVGIINCDETIKKVLIVCPASLKINWQRELQRWLTRPMWTTIVGEWFPASADIAVLNYDVLHKHARALQSREFDLVIFDEAHYLKNPDSRRSQNAYAIRAKRKLMLTGTPIVNRPAELWPLVAYLSPEEFGDRKKYERAYCDASPATPAGRHALSQLQSKLRITLMIRRLKKDVLTELPPKVRQVIELPPGNASAQVRREQEALNEFLEELFMLRVKLELAKAAESDNEYIEAREELQAKSSAMFGQIARMRHETALAKVPAVAAHAKDVLANGGKVVIFVHHIDVAKALKEALGAS